MCRIVIAIRACFQKIDGFTALPTKRELLADMKRLLCQTTFTLRPDRYRVVQYINSSACSFSTTAIRLSSFPDFQFILFKPTQTRY